MTVSRAVLEWIYWLSVTRIVVDTALSISPVFAYNPTLYGDSFQLANARGIDHLDIKPDNVLLDEEETPKLADWGLARIAFNRTQTDTQLGLSPPYAAPEQIDKTLGSLDHRTDIYQLGVTAYELLTGELPFDPTAPESIERRILAGNPEPPSEHDPVIPKRLDEIVLTAMAADREQRYEAVIQLRNALEDCRDVLGEETE